MKDVQTSFSQTNGQTRRPVQTPFSPEDSHAKAKAKAKAKPSSLIKAIKCNDLQVVEESDSESRKEEENQNEVFGGVDFRVVDLCPVWTFVCKGETCSGLGPGFFQRLAASSSRSLVGWRPLVGSNEGAFSVGFCKERSSGGELVKLHHRVRMVYRPPFEHVFTIQEPSDLGGAYTSRAVW